MELNSEFFKKFLDKMEGLFQDKNMSIIECKRNEDGKTMYALAATRINPVSKLLEFTPVCFFWDKNPMQSMSVTEQPLVASQKSMNDWANEADKITVTDYQMLN